jgi:2-octaprenyl-6-methoxyphenol hydroxylase
MSKQLDTDVIIIGGGLSGLTMAALLGEARISCVCIDRDPPADQLAQKYDGRTTAISFASHRVLQAAGAWDLMIPDCEPILDIRVADGTMPFYLDFASATDGEGQPFGWIIENGLMRKALFQNVKRLKKYVRHIAPAEAKDFFVDDDGAGVTLKDGTKISAPLLIGADGRNSTVRAWLGIDAKKIDYKQTAIVCNVVHERGHKNLALEHFLPAGPFAVLPMTDKDGEHRSSVVWTEHGGDVQRFLQLPPAAFDKRLQELFGDYLGHVRHVSSPMAYPLTLLHAETYIAKRTALMAEAAHAIHPIAGQGLNLSLRDAAALTELIVEHKRAGLDIGSETLLRRYESWRRPDTLLMAGATDLLNRLFSNDLKSVAAVRNMGLGIVQKLPVLKRFFASSAMGISGNVPKIIKNGHI